MTLTQNSINGIKLHIASVNNILPEDITDAEVFTYLKDAADYENHRSVWLDKNYREHYTPSRSAKTIASHILTYSINI